MKTYIETEVMGYNIFAQGYIMAGDVHNLSYEVLNLDLNEEVPEEKLSDIEEQLKEALIEQHYNPELYF